ncbi:pilus assembly protein [Erythrobacter sp. LQ02-29]|uniref:TadE/TadG family type IV pilus assembly protein n=1 Tax=Erythrobacter sp. LQ02-29 TaxID=2920384 RepID=UPI001F4EDAEA|nr:TadE/TadG family type IV pilus assembly protein [Erythrobacter sp. LQ02-29]MCP9222845.1 pilus assembly protein [Erythrobacter sp. LQ02-29]
MIRRLFPSRIARDERGATIVEFALILIPLLTVIIAGLDFGYQSYVRAVMQGAVNDAARRASVQNPELAYAGDSVEDQVEQMIRDQIGSIAIGADIDVKQTSFYRFSSIGNAEPLLTDVNKNGRFDANDGDCWRDENGNGVYDTDQSAGATGRGSPDDVIFYQVDALVPRLFNSGWLWGGSDEFELALEAAVRNQPFGERVTPPVLCGKPVASGPGSSGGNCNGHGLAVGLNNGTGNGLGLGVCVGGIGVNVNAGGGNGNGNGNGNGRP